MRSISERPLWIVFALTVLGAIIFAASRSHTPIPPTGVGLRAGLGGMKSPAAPRLIASYGKLPLSFEINRGQTDPQVKFLSRGSGYTMFLTGSEAVLSLRSSGEFTSPRHGGGKPSLHPIGSGPLSVVRRALRHSPDPGLRTGDWLFPPLIQNPKSQIQDSPAPGAQSPAPSVLRMKLVGANPNAKVVGLDPLPGKSNYFIGNDPKKWRTNVPQYAKVKYKNIYPGIDLVYYGNQGRVEHDFVVAPGADPNTIQFEILGAGGANVEASLPRHRAGGGVKPPLRIDPNGDLVIPRDGGDVRLHKPVVYQPVAPTVAPVSSPANRSAMGTSPLQPNPKSQIENPKSVDGSYVLLANNHVGFDLSAYDPTLPLIIDPVLEYSTYLGGSANEEGEGFDVDDSGHAYITGDTGSVDFPTMNPFQATLTGSMDVFVAKVNPEGSGLVYCTYIGGNGNWERANGIAVDSAGNAYVTGWTDSTDFPIMNAIQPDFGGGVADAFAFKLDGMGSTLDYSTYLGGSQVDAGGGIALDNSGSAYIAGLTMSTNFPTVYPFQATLAGGMDSFVAKLAPSGSGLVYSTYFGGSGGDIGYGIAVDISHNAYIVGSTDSTDLPRLNPIQPNLAGGEDAFVAKLNAAGLALEYSTYLGGSSQDQCFRISVDTSSDAYVIGLTQSSNFPTTPGSFQPTFAGGCGLGNCGDAFVTKLGGGGSPLVFSTYLGGATGLDQASGVDIDPSHNVYVTGFTNSVDFPTVSPIQAAFAGGYFDGFVVEMNSQGSALLFSTYLGGTGGDQGAGGIIVKSYGAVYVGGVASANFPVTSGAFQTTYGGGDIDAFVAKIGLDNTPAGTDVTIQPIASLSLTFDEVTTSGTTTATPTSTGPPPPSGFSLGDPPTYYDLSTMATFTGWITVCINYSGISFPGGTGPQLFHFESGMWGDVTTTVDLTNQIVCGRVTSLSPFAVFAAPYVASVQQPIDSDGSSVFRAARGVVPVKFTLALGGTPTCDLPPATISLTRISGGTVGPVDESVYILPSDNGSSFRVSDCQYVYNLSTKSLGTGTYRVNIVIGGTAVGSATFGLK